MATNPRSTSTSQRQTVRGRATSSAERLATPVQFVKGVGPQRAKLLGKLGVETVEDLLFQLPRDYRDLTDLRRIGELEEGALQSVRGEVVDLDLRDLGGGRSVVGILVNDGQEHLRAVWFNQPYMAEKFRTGDVVMLSARPRERGGRWEMNSPKVQWVGGDEDGAGGGGQSFVPVYPLTDGLSAGAMQRIVHHAVEEYLGDVAETLPEALRREHRLAGIVEALQWVHLPETREQIDEGRRRLVYEEFLLLQLALLLRKGVWKEHRKAPLLEATARIDARIRRLYGFELTAGQDQAIAEIVSDMASGRPMSRLLQGEVGSGKTAVAVYALLLAIAHGHQAVLMAPTEVLAQQHWQTLEAYLAQSRVRRVLLTGALTAAQRSETLGKIRAGELDLVVGTQAVIQKDVHFKQLGLVVIDEQHKFGVRQRAHFRRAGQDPHYLVMSATPIPRTLSMTLFGDLDISTLKDLPPGRQPVNTYVVEPGDRAKCWEFLRKKLREGRQGFVVCPLIGEGGSGTRDQGSGIRDEGPTSSSFPGPWRLTPDPSVHAVYEELRGKELRGFGVGLLHGRMDDEEKRRVMGGFQSGKTRVLVTTTVIEVGVDVPNATVMVVESAERFGLSQLHQLRGRIARGSYAGFCFLLPATENAESLERLELVADTRDGFEIAEADFRLRGPGELLGTRQHGLPPLRAGDLLADRKLLQEARRHAGELLKADPGLRAAEQQPLRAAVLARYGRSLDLADVG